MPGEPKIYTFNLEEKLAPGVAEKGPQRDSGNLPQSTLVHAGTRWYTLVHAGTGWYSWYAWYAGTVVQWYSRTMFQLSLAKRVCLGI